MRSKYTETVLESVTVRPQKPLHQLLPGAPRDALDLLSKLLIFNPVISARAPQSFFTTKI